MRNNEGRMRKVELHIYAAALTRSDNQRRYERDVQRHGQAAGRSRGAQDRNLARGNDLAGRARESGLRIRGSGEGHVSRISAKRDNGSGVSARRNADVIEDIRELIELDEIDHVDRVRGGV